MDFSFDDLIDLYKSDKVVFNLISSDTVYCYMIGAGTSKITSKVPVEQRKATDIISYGSLYFPYRTKKSSVRMHRSEDIDIVDVLGYENRIPNIKNINKLVEKYPSDLCEKNTKVGVNMPPIHYVLNELFENIHFRSDEFSFTTRYNNGMSNSIEGKFAIEIPEGMFNRGGEFFKKFYDGKFLLSETSYGIVTRSGYGVFHSYFLVLGEEFLEREKFLEFTRTTKLFHNTSYTLNRKKTVNVFIGTDYKKAFLDGILSENRLKDANKIVGEIIK